MALSDVLSSLLLASSVVSATPLLPRTVAPAVSSVQDLGYVTDPGFNPGIYRDGGGGACFDGLCVIGLSDSFTTNTGSFETSQAGLNGQGYSSFVHNSFATFPTKGSASPTSVTDFGTINGGRSSFVGPVLTPIGPIEENMGSNFAIWPNSNMVSLLGLADFIPGSFVVGVANALTETGGTLYNTMYAIQVSNNVQSGQTMRAERIAPELFQASENLYGTFCITRGQNDTFLYLLSVTTTGTFGPSYLKVARVPAPLAAVRAAYTYWDGSIWSPIQPSVSDTTSAIYSSNDRLDTGELFWSTYHGAWLLVTQTFGEFRVARANTDDFTQGFSAPSTIYTAQLPASNDGDDTKVIYGGHTYPDWDSSGKSMLISWCFDVAWVQMAVVNWA